MKSFSFFVLQPAIDSCEKICKEDLRELIISFFKKTLAEIDEKEKSMFLTKFVVP